MSRQYNEQAVAEACKFVDELRAHTKCAKCGSQPIEWHHITPQPGDRWIAHLRIQGATIRRIQEELLKCEALCRKYHMESDGRLRQLAGIAPRKKGQKYVGPQACELCKKISNKTWKKKCRSCYDGLRRQTTMPDGTKVDRRFLNEKPGGLESLPDNIQIVESKQKEE